MTTQHTPESIKELPHTTVEQVIRFREAALRIEQQRDELLADLTRISEYPRAQNQEYSASWLRAIASGAIAKAGGAV
jgi:hypothetical protein